MRARIIAAAYKCFDRFGIVKTTIEDIAHAAAVSRPGVYNHFTGKSDILREITALEMNKVSAEIRRQIDRSARYSDTLTEALLVAAKMSSKNTYMRRHLESVTLSSEVVDPSGPDHKILRNRWAPFIERGLRSGDLASDLDVDDIVSWLTLSLIMLQIKTDTRHLSDPDLRRFIRRMIVEPLVSGHPQKR